MSNHDPHPDSTDADGVTVDGVEASGEPATVRVRVRPLVGEVPAGASLRVSLLDDSTADVATAPVATSVIGAWTGDEVVVEVEVPPDAPPSLAVFAHLGASEEDFRSGDWITTAAHPVLEPLAGGAEVTIELSPI